MINQNSNQASQLSREHLQLEAVYLHSEWSIQRRIEYDNLCLRLWRERWNFRQDDSNHQTENNRVAISQLNRLCQHLEQRIHEKCVRKPVPTLQGTGKSVQSSAKRIQSMEDKWSRRFNELRRFVEKNGHCNVPYKYKGNKALGLWVQSQRTKYFQDSMLPHRIKKLEDAGFNWVIKKKHCTWKSRYDDLVEFYKIHKHCNVSVKCPKHYSLAVWANCQRQNYRKYIEGETSPITVDRIDALEKIEFKWSLNDAAWEEKYQQLKLFMKQNAFSSFPNKCQLNAKLSRWVATQRNWYSNICKDQMSDIRKNRIKKLEKLPGFQWSQYS